MFFICVNPGDKAQFDWLTRVSGAPVVDEAATSLLRLIVEETVMTSASFSKSHSTVPVQ